MHYTSATNLRLAAIEAGHDLNAHLDLADSTVSFDHVGSQIRQRLTIPNRTGSLIFGFWHESQYSTAGTPMSDGQEFIRDPASLLRGLLIDYRGIFTQKSDQQRVRLGMDAQYPIGVGVHSSAQSVHAVQQLFDQKPGIDAFQLEAQPDYPDPTNITPGVWLENVARKTLPASSTHGGWDLIALNTPSAYVDLIAQRAEVLQQNFGCKIDPDNACTPPNEVVTFANAMRALPNYTNRLFELVASIDTNNPESRTAAVIQRLNQSVSIGQRDEERARNIDDRQMLRSKLFQLGLLRSESANISFRRVDTQFAGQIAQNLLNLEEIIPKPDDTQAARTSRIKSWQELIERARHQKPIARRK